MPRNDPGVVACPGYSRRGDRSPRLCYRTVHESFHLTRLLGDTPPVMGTPAGL